MLRSDSTIKGKGRQRKKLYQNLNKPYHGMHSIHQSSSISSAGDKIRYKNYLKDLAKYNSKVEHSLSPQQQNCLYLWMNYQLIMKHYLHLL